MKNFQILHIESCIYDIDNILNSVYSNVYSVFLYNVLLYNYV